MNRRYADPYVAGVGLGLALLTAYAVAGRGLGASGAFASVAASAAVVAGESAVTSAAVAPYVPDGARSVFTDWLVVEMVGVAIGGYLSARFAGRAQRMLVAGAGVTPSSRVLAAVAGGALMAIGARFARGCTSGQALSGGALLSAGSWIFIVTCFGSAFVTAPLARRLWR